jgi:hypothetical protein
LTPVQRAELHLRLEAEETTWHLRGLSHLLDAWGVFESDNRLLPEPRYHALGLLGFAARQMAERLETFRALAADVAKNPQGQKRRSA